MEHVHVPRQNVKELRRTIRYLIMLADQHVEIWTRHLQNCRYPLDRVFR